MVVAETGSRASESSYRGYWQFHDLSAAEWKDWIVFAACGAGIQDSKPIFGRPIPRFATIPAETGCEW